MDLYPGYYFINAESETMHSHWLTAKELIVSPSKFLKKGALVILCSHGGNTKETVEAAKLASERGAAVITMTHNPQSVCAQEEMNPVVYSWEEDTNEKDRPQGIVMRVLNELMKLQEPSYTKYDAVLDGLEKADRIVRAAVKKYRTAHGYLPKNISRNHFCISWVLAHRTLRRMGFPSAPCRKCSGWTAATCILGNISMDRLSARMRIICTSC